MADNTYTVRASQSGFVTQDVPVFVANTPVGVSITLERAVPPPFGDSNCDGIVDLADHAGFTACITGPLGSAGPGCEIFDSEPDGNIDLIDYAALATALTAP